LRAAFPLAGLLAAGLVGVSVSVSRPGVELSAESFQRDDADADGLSDAQELVEHTSPYLVDTDGDGYSDVEELARGSAAFAPYDTPLPGDTALEMTARGENGRVHVVMLVYFTDGELEDMIFSFGLVLRSGTVVPLSPGHLLANAVVTTRPTLDGEGEVGLIEFDISPNPIHLLEHFALFATMSTPGSGVIECAAAVDLFSDENGVVLKSGKSHTPFSSSRGQSGGGTGTFYQPIPPSDGLPMGWEPGRICHQKTVPVGYDSGVVLTRVVSAKCEDGWDSFCSSTECKASIGDEYSTIDPVGLVGG
jgi:hypothetical protein